MSDVSVWSFFAFMNEEGAEDERSRPAEWQVLERVRWAMARGYDHIYLSRDPTEKARFERAAPCPIRTHMHLVEEPSCEPGDEAA